MKRIEVATNTLTYIDVPSEDDRMVSIENLNVEQRPPIIVLNSPVRFLTGKRNKVIIDGHRRAFVHPYTRISALEIVEDGDINEARSLIEDREHFLHVEPDSIRTVLQLKKEIAKMIAAIYHVRPIYYLPKYKQQSQQRKKQTKS